jgi:hypothetical protein
MQVRTVVVSLIRVSLLSMVWGTTELAGQWLNYPAEGIPRFRDGKPDLSAPTPRTPDGKPDLSGIWFINETPLNEFGRADRGGGSTDQSE